MSNQIIYDLDELKLAYARGRRVFHSLRLDECDGFRLDLSDSVLNQCSFRAARLGHASFRRINLDKCCFQQALLWGSDLSESCAIGSKWYEADLSGARLQCANFSEAALHRCCLRGVLAAGSCWNNAKLIEADFRSGLDQLTDLGDSDFRDSDLSFALLQGVRLHHASFVGASLYGADLSNADLMCADLSGCDLRDTKLNGAILQGSKLEGALL